jgi:hypothetical protein
MRTADELRERFTVRPAEPADDEPDEDQDPEAAVDGVPAEDDEDE